MDRCPWRIVSRHFFAAKTSKGSFEVSVEGLRPYRITEGVWYIRPRYIEAKNQHSRSGDYCGGALLISNNSVSENETPLLLAAFKWTPQTETFVDLSSQDSSRITRPSTTLEFSLKTSDWREFEISDSQEFVLGFELVQISYSAPPESDGSR